MVIDELLELLDMNNYYNIKIEYNNYIYTFKGKGLCVFIQIGNLVKNNPFKLIPKQTVSFNSKIKI